MKIKVYFACALTHASSESKAELRAFKDVLRAMKNVEILDFLGEEYGTANDVYEHDIHECVKHADLIITECSGPSTGLGWELGAAVEHFRKDVLAVARKSSKVTRLVTGAKGERNPHFSFQNYDSMEHLLFICTEKIKEVYEQKKSS